MNSVERVKAICKERKIPISRLEKDCGFANGYIGQLKKGSFPDDRAIKIADYLGITVNDLMYDEPPQAPALTAEEQTLLNIFKELNAEGREKVINYARDILPGHSGRAKNNPPSSLAREA